MYVCVHAYVRTCVHVLKNRNTSRRSPRSSGNLLPPRPAGICESAQNAISAAPPPAPCQCHSSPCLQVHTCTRPRERITWMSIERLIRNKRVTFTLLLLLCHWPPAECSPHAPSTQAPPWLQSPSSSSCLSTHQSPHPLPVNPISEAALQRKRGRDFTPPGPLQAPTTSPKDLCEPPNPSPRATPTYPPWTTRVIAKQV